MPWGRPPQQLYAASLVSTYLLHFVTHSYRVLSFRQGTYARVLDSRRCPRATSGGCPPWSICCSLITAYAALALLKIPSLLQGRLWAEDGLLLLDALQRPWWQALATPHTGYIDVVAGGAMLIATHFADLEHVALVSILLALVIQLCPAMLLITSRCAWLSRAGLCVALLLILTPPVGKRFGSAGLPVSHLMVCTGLILAFEPRTGPVGALQLTLLLLAGLTGPGPALVAPFFIGRACFDRSRRRAVQAAVLSIGALVEIAVFCTHRVGRHLGISAFLLLRVIYVEHVLIPLFGHALPEEASFLVQWSAIPIFAPLLLFGALSFVVLKTRVWDMRWLYAATLGMMVFSYFGAIGQADLLKIYPGARLLLRFPQVLLGPKFLLDGAASH